MTLKVITGQLVNKCGLAENKVFHLPEAGVNQYGIVAKYAEQWLVDMPPVTPGVHDDEFTALTMGAAWTHWDLGNKVTDSYSAYGMKLASSNNVGHSWGGIIRPIHTGDFAIVIKMGLSVPLNDHVYCGLAVLQWEGGTGLLTWGFHASAAWMVISADLWTDYQTFSANSYYSPVLALSSVYLRIRRAGTTYYCDYSTDGLNWIRCYSSGIAAFTPALLGILLDNNLDGIGTPVSCKVQFYRYSTNTTYDRPVYGRALLV